MAEISERTKELHEKIRPFNDHVRIKWEEIDEWSERDIEITKLFLLRKIDQQTNRTAKNVAFITWITIIGFILSLIIIAEM